MFKILHYGPDIPVTADLQKQSREVAISSSSRLSYKVNKVSALRTCLPFLLRLAIKV